MLLSFSYRPRPLFPNLLRSDCQTCKNNNFDCGNCPNYRLRLLQTGTEGEGENIGMINTPDEGEGENVGMINTPSEGEGENKEV